MTELEKSSQPRVVHGEKVPANLELDKSDIAGTMRELGISSETIDKTTVYLDPTNRLGTNGIAYPKTLGRLRHIFNPKLRDAPGPIVRISTKVRGKERTTEEMNHTLSHELEHVAQMDRKDANLKLGHLAIWGGALLGAAVGNRLGSSKKARMAGTVVGAMIGQQIGYKIAPHERQAREKSKHITTSAIKHQLH